MVSALDAKRLSERRVMAYRNPLKRCPLAEYRAHRELRTNRRYRAMNSAMVRGALSVGKALRSTTEKVARAAALLPADHDPHDHVTARLGAISPVKIDGKRALFGRAYGGTKTEEI